MREIFKHKGRYLLAAGVAAALAHSCKMEYDRQSDIRGRIQDAEMIEHAVQPGDNLTCYRQSEGLPGTRVVIEAYENRVMNHPENKRYRPVGAPGFGSRPNVPDPNTLFEGTAIWLPDANGRDGVGCRTAVTVDK